MSKNCVRCVERPRTRLDLLCDECGAAADWFRELQSVAVTRYGFTVNAARSFDPTAWEEYRLEGLSPSQAIEEDAKSA